MTCGIRMMPQLLAVCLGMFLIVWLAYSCSFLRYSSGEPSVRSKFGKVPTDFIADDVMCEGTEKSLFDCKHRPHANCGETEGAGVICKGNYLNLFYDIINMTKTILVRPRVNYVISFWAVNYVICFFYRKLWVLTTTTLWISFTKINTTTDMWRGEQPTP